MKILQNGQVSFGQKITGESIRLLMSLCPEQKKAADYVSVDIEQKQSSIVCG
jgi:hypothetical protein